MPAQNVKIQKLSSLFSDQPCWQLETLAEKLSYSARSIQRYLSTVGYHRSFSHNGKWYTLKGIPKFDSEGLWFSDNIGFSKDGNLNKTLIRLITKSPAGMTSEDLGEKLRCRLHTVLAQLCRRGQIQREKVGRSFIYLAKDPRIAANQHQAISSLKCSPVMLPAEIAVLVLAEFIRNPQTTFQQLAEALHKTSGINIESTQVERLFEHHDLKKNSANCAAKALKALKHNYMLLFQEVSPAALFPKPFIVHFRPESQNCSCGTTLNVQKTRYKNVLSMLGPYIAHETVLKCPQCFQVFTSESLLGLVKSHSNVTFDVLVFVGRALFQRHLSLEKVQTELLLRNTRLSLSEINYLGRKFIFYLALGHAQATPGIRMKMQMNGGYVLHLDATHEGDSPALMSGIDSLSQFVLANVKVSGEKAEHISPFLQEIKSTYGTPLPASMTWEQAYAKQ